MGKLSNLPIETNFSLSDFLVKVKTAAAGDVLVTLANLLSAVNGNTSVISSQTLTNPYKFNVYRNAAWTTVNSLTKVQFDTKLFDTGSNYDATTNYRFTAPIAGFYLFTWRAASLVPDLIYAASELYKNGSALALGDELVSGGGGQNSSSGSLIIQAAANDYFEIYYLVNTSAQTGEAGSNATYFTGFLVSAT